MTPLLSKGRGSFVDRYAIKSVAYEMCIWLLFWGLYSLWAGYSPSYPKSENSEPLFPLVVLCFMLVFFFLFGDRKELKLLIGNSIIALFIVPGFLVLSIYRALTKKSPESWAAAGFFGSQYTFFFIQCIFLFLSVLLIHHTLACWKAADPAIKKRFYRGIVAIVTFLLFLSVLVAFFVFAGKTGT
jgi:hypothetical protein